MPPRQLVSFDWAIKKLLRSKANFEILEGFLSELLKTDITILEILESETNKENAVDRSMRTDLKVKNSRHEIILIEVQFASEFDFLLRMLFGTSKAITEHMKEGDRYSEAVKVFSVNIVYFDLGIGEDYIYWGRNHFRGIHFDDELQLNAKQREVFSGYKKAYELFPEYYLIKVNRFDDLAKDTLDEWVYFLKNSEIKEEFQAKGLKKASEALAVMQLNDADRKNYENYREGLSRDRSALNTSFDLGLEEGEQIGLEKGKQIGRDEGLQEGKQIGLEKGEQIGLEKGETIGQIKALNPLLPVPLPLPDAWESHDAQQLDQWLGEIRQGFSKK